MKLIDRYGGLGVIALNEQEEEKIHTLLGLITLNGRRDFLGRDSPRTPEYNALMEEFFPAFPRSYKVIRRDSSRFLDKNNNPLGRCEELVINGRITLKGDNCRNDVELSIVFPNGNENKHYLMTVSLHPLYQLDVVDDVAELLGKRENSSVSAPQDIPWWDTFHQQKEKDKQIGFAEVPYLGTIRAIYDKALRLVDECDRRVTVSRKDIDILRQDAAENPNLFVRSESKSMYSGILRGLTNK